MRQNLIYRINIIDNQFRCSSKYRLGIKHCLLIIIYFDIHIFLLLFLLFIYLLFLFLLLIILLNILLILNLVLVVVVVRNVLNLCQLIILLFHDFQSNLFVLLLSLHKLKHFLSTILNVLENLFNLLELSNHDHKLITNQVRCLLLLKNINAHFLSDLLVN